MEYGGAQWWIEAPIGASRPFGPADRDDEGKGGAGVFLGTHAPRLDDKGRLILPAKFRDQLAGGLVVTKGQERSLNVWPTAEFARITEGLSGAPVTSKAVRDYQRMLFAGASDEKPDKQGRVTIPLALREYAALTRDCVVIGANNHVEIWNTENWTAYEAAQEEGFSALSDEVLPGIF